MYSKYFNEQLDQKTNKINQSILSYLPEDLSYQKIIVEAIEYSVSACGKRIRPIIMNEVNAMFDGENTTIGRLAIAIEYIHNYSLIHDDLPAMDNDALRRGRPTSHIVYGEDIAILAGDGLLNYAYEILFEGILQTSGIMR